MVFTEADTRAKQIDPKLKYIFQALDSDIYDVIDHLTYNLKIKTRIERAIAV